MFTFSLARNFPNSQFDERKSANVLFIPALKRISKRSEINYAENVYSNDRHDNLQVA